MPSPATPSPVTSGPARWEPLTLLPHRFPLLLVDRITGVEPGKRATGVKTVTGNEWSSIGSSADGAAQEMPHLLIVEALAQLSAAVLVTLLEGSEGAIGYFLGITNVRFRGRAAPGDVLQMEITLRQFKRGVCKTRGIARVNGADVVRADLTTIIKVADAKERAALG
ncbi:MAG TPA: 3-hydroxyacyl-ACP dehydratase FabZ family protein [Gemmatimonadaceae bacterium]|nr:3-hydroxyacyl-ACP dehydratase FabZ family protein [Gemmatimonadaceae bacterium]